MTNRPNPELIVALAIDARRVTERLIAEGPWSALPLAARLTTSSALCSHLLSVLEDAQAWATVRGIDAPWVKNANDIDALTADDDLARIIDAIITPPNAILALALEENPNE